MSVVVIALIVGQLFAMFTHILRRQCMRSAGAGDGNSWEARSCTRSGGCSGGVGRGSVRVLLLANHPARFFTVTPLKVSLV